MFWHFGEGLGGNDSCTVYQLFKVAVSVRYTCAVVLIGLCVDIAYYLCAVVLQVCQQINSFLPRELCSRSICHGRVSVSVSVTSRCSTKMAKHRNMPTTPHDSPWTLVL